MGAIKVIRVVIDTNVVVSALLFGGVPGKLADLWRSGAIRPCICRESIDELLRVLSYPKFDLSEEEIQYLLHAEVLPHADVFRIASGPVIVRDDPDDDIYLHCAIAANARFLISGDRHLLRLATHQRVSIVSPADFLKTFRN